jgi:hypothetical protein
MILDRRPPSAVTLDPRSSNSGITVSEAMSADPAPLPDTMRALRFTRYRAPAEALATTQAPLPTLTPGESLVEVHAAGINPRDVAAVASRFGPMLPAIPGRDFAGVEVMSGSADTFRRGRTERSRVGRRS